MTMEGDDNDNKSKKITVWEANVVEQAIRSSYDAQVIGHIQRASLIREGFNHNYKIEMHNGTKYVFRVYLPGKYYVKDQTNGDDLKFELDLLTYLRSKGLGVAEPIVTENGSTLGSTTFEHEPRFFALFHFAKGKAWEDRWKMPTQQQYFDLGKLIAQIHVAADEFETQHYRYHLNDETYLLDETLNALDAQFRSHDMEDTTFFRPFAEDLRAKIVPALPKRKPTYGIIHADLHPGNIFFDDTSNQVTIIDFDHCAYGWRAYDLAPCRELGNATCQAILEGYHSVRPLGAAELESFESFQTLRAIWDLGDIALYQPLWGEPVDRRFLERATRQLRCIMMGDSSSYCRPPLWIVAANMVVNFAVLAMAVWACRKMVQKSACIRHFGSEASSTWFKKNRTS